MVTKSSLWSIKTDNIFNEKNYFSNEKEFLYLFNKIHADSNKKIKDLNLYIKKDIFCKPNLKIIKNHLH